MTSPGPAVPPPSANRPTGAITFLFTDVEGSTQLWEHHPAWMEAAHRRHEAILREAMAAQGGWVYKQIGDAFQAAFQTAPAALAAAVAAQRLLAAAPWGGPGPLKVRMALHTGQVEERPDDYVGPLLNRVQRLMSAGHGGQVLLTATTAELVREHLPPSVELRDVGERRLKDLIRAEHIYQVVANGLPADFPPLRTLDARPNNLPLQLTSFVGRERELAEVARLLGAIRLLTLTGAGGSGKTRLALQVAANLLDEYADGVWFVDLAPLADPALVPKAVAVVLEVREEAGRPLLATLIDALRSRRLLLLLDNCEHLIGACAEFSERLLRACPEVRLLATSREALSIAGETSYRVPSLTVPDPQALPSLLSLTQYEAVRLFIDRALAVHPGFQVTNANAPALAQLCVRLDGIPLAIELAAARVQLLTVEQIAARLDDRFRLLTGGSRTALPRQQTLRSLIDWSYDLLPSHEQSLLRRLAVFAGGWTLEAAEAVCPGDGIDAYAVLDLLGQLANKSLVLVEEQGEVERYRLLETIRKYAEEKLLATGETTAARQAHLVYYPHLAETGCLALHGSQQLVWLQRLEAEHDNLRAALDWATEHDFAVALRLAAALGEFWWLHSHLTEGRSRLAQVLARSSATTVAECARAQSWASALAWQQGDFAAARSHAEAGATLARQAGDRSALAHALFRLGVAVGEQGGVARAVTLLEESTTLSRELGDDYTLTNRLTNLAYFSNEQGDTAKARLLLEEALSLARQLGNLEKIAHALENLGEVAYRQEDYATARQVWEEGLELNRELGHRYRVAVALHHLGYSDLQRGAVRAARVRLQDSLRLLCGMETAQVVRDCLAGLVCVAQAEGSLARVAQLSGALDIHLSRLGTPLHYPDSVEYPRHVAIASKQLDSASWAAAYTAGQAMTLEDAVAYALEEATDA